ncbi:DDE superfamily endonuclease [Halogranum amylolyticum]|uniref:DDE superfamily endonuclease n=1 Tax=Halogranum amylolyticum TaxID=660520 RepID=A0A1H8VN60_9EURY|nr:DDE superfamily endonuclease [Halogranum amylolyticum]
MDTYRAETTRYAAQLARISWVRLSAYTPELNPVEECWRQLKDALDNRFFESLDEHNTASDTALDRLSIPDISNYF